MGSRTSEEQVTPSRNGRSRSSSRSGLPRPGSAVERKQVPAPVERVVPKWELMLAEFERKKDAGRIVVRSNEATARRYEKNASSKLMLQAGLILAIPFFGAWGVGQLGKWGQDRVAARDAGYERGQAVQMATAFALITPLVVAPPTIMADAVTTLTPAIAVRSSIPQVKPMTADDWWIAFGGAGTPRPTVLIVVAPSPVP